METETKQRHKTLVHLNTHIRFWTLTASQIQPLKERDSISTLFPVE